MGFGRREGDDGILLLNLYAYIYANPMALGTCSDPVGPDNDTHLRKTLTEQAQRGTPVVAGWGATAMPNPNRVAQVLGLSGRGLACLGSRRRALPGTRCASGVTSGSCHSAEISDEHPRR